MKWSNISFRHRMLIIMALSGLIELMILAMAGFIYAKHSQEQEIGRQALGVSSFLSKSADVLDIIETGATDDDQYRIRRLTEMIGAAFIVIGDKNGIRLVHPVDERIGLPMRGGDNDAALIEGKQYISYAQGSLGHSVRGKSAVFNARGEIIGVVSVGYLIDSLQDKVEPFLAFLLLMAFVVVVANALVSSIASKRFQRAILGFEPEEIGRLFVEMDVTLETLKEGIISIDADGKLRSINKSACDILNINKSKALNKPLEQVLPDSDLTEVLRSARIDNDVNLYLSGQRLIANRSPIIVDGRVVGAVSSFRLKDELNELSVKLAKTKEYAEMLRSQTHEHRNKLNAIGGLVQMGELDAVQQLIGQETAHYQSLIEFLRETIKEPLVAGMLLGKSERARELGLELMVEPGTRLESLPDRLNAEDLVTILSNLIDNGLEAVRQVIDSGEVINPARRKVEVSISDYGKQLILEVTDQGCGLPDNPDNAELLMRGVSYKNGQDRGVGLYLVREIVERYRGEIELANNARHGARVTVYLHKEEPS